MRLPYVFKSILSQLGISQKDFATKAALPLNSIRHIGSGRRPRKDTLEVILGHLPLVHQGELLAAWLDDSIPDQHRDQLEVRTTDNDPDHAALLADTPEALIARDAIFKDLCLPTRKAIIHIKQAARKDPEIAKRLRVLAEGII
jgi:hypothetical protein